MQNYIPEYFQPQHLREDKDYHVIELDGITFVEYRLYEKPALCKAHLTENMFLKRVQIVVSGFAEGMDQPKTFGARQIPVSQHR